MIEPDKERTQVKWFDVNFSLKQILAAVIFVGTILIAVMNVKSDMQAAILTMQTEQRVQAARIEVLTRDLMRVQSDYAAFQAEMRGILSGFSSMLSDVRVLIEKGQKK